MRIIVSGGGTGGHIYPAITLINNIKKLVPNAEFLYVGTKKGLEADIIPREQIPFVTLDISGFERHLTMKNFVVAGKAFKAVVKARNIVKNFKPDVAIGTGGYVCGPILMAASLMGIPALIQEQNAIPGVTNKILARFVNKIAVGYKRALSYFPENKVVFTGNPIRDDILLSTRNEGLMEFSLDTTKKTILVSGGSRGAHSINKAMFEVHKHFANNYRVQIMHVTGKNEYDFVKNGLADLGVNLDKADNLAVYPYLYDMPKALAATDIAVFRAGATSLAELTARGVPAVLIPYPFAAENHQEFNARELEKNGAAKVILNRELTGEKLINVLEEMLASENRLQEMVEASRNMGKPSAALAIAEIVVDLAKKTNY